MTKQISQKKPKKKRRIPLLVKLLFVLLIILAATFAVFFFYMRRQTEPSRIADNYVSVFMSKNTSALFDVMGFERDTFITPETLSASLEERQKYSTISSYGMVEYSSDDPDNMRQYSIQYWNDNRGNPYTQTLVLNNSEPKLYYLFDNWKIDTSEFLARNCVITAPMGAEVKVDDITLTSEMAESGGTDTITYRLGNLFAGTHTLTVLMDSFNEFHTSIYLDGGDYNDRPLYTVTPSMLQITDQTREMLEKEAEDLITAIYDRALEGESFNKLSQKFTVEESARSGLEQAFQTLITNNIDSSTHLTGVDFDSFSSTSGSAYAEDHCYAVKITTETRYTASSYVAGSGQTAAGSRSTAGNSLFTTTFHYKNGAWSVFSSTAFESCVYYMRY